MIMGCTLECDKEMIYWIGKEAKSSKILRERKWPQLRKDNHDKKEETPSKYSLKGKERSKDTWRLCKASKALRHDEIGI